MNRNSIKTFVKKTFYFLLLMSFYFNNPVFAVDFELSPGFSYSCIPPEVQKFMDGKSYKKNEYVRFQDLKFCKVLHVGFDGQDHEGELIVAHETIAPTGETINIAKEVLEIFKELYDTRYPIEKIKLIDNYNAIDEESMLDNNSSGFIFRYIRDTKMVSWHSYGLAIDINPFVNPCFQPDSKIVEPAGTEKFLDRTLDQYGLIKDGDACYKAFTSRGWEWGGHWDDPIDYMHFQKFCCGSPKPKPKYIKINLE